MYVCDAHGGCKESWFEEFWFVFSVLLHFASVLYSCGPIFRISSYFWIWSCFCYCFTYLYVFLVFLFGSQLLVTSSPPALSPLLNTRNHSPVWHLLITVLVYILPVFPLIARSVNVSYALVSLDYNACVHFSLSFWRFSSSLNTHLFPLCLLACLPGFLVFFGWSGKVTVSMFKLDFYI